MTVVSRAFQVLSDPDKRAAFDRHGDDPDSRTAGMGGASPFGNGFPGMRTTYRGAGGMYGEEMSPDELFNMFFGGGFSGGGFNGTPRPTPRSVLTKRWFRTRRTGSYIWWSPPSTTTTTTRQRPTPGKHLNLLPTPPNPNPPPRNHPPRHLLQSLHTNPPPLLRPRNSLPTLHPPTSHPATLNTLLCQPL
jgi:curved DNA-binding protein CbpA